MWCTNKTHNKFDGLKQLTYMVYVFVVPLAKNQISSLHKNVFSDLVHVTFQYLLKNTNTMNFIIIYL
jgi:hypothetical protein